MKQKRKLIIIIILILLIGSVSFSLRNTNKYLNNLLGYAIDFVNHQTNDLQKINGTGSLIDNKDNLKDSKITGEEYVNNDIYYPYYTFIGDNEKKLYKQIYQNIIAYQTTFIPVVSVNKDNLENAITAVYNDHPEIFWTDLDYSYKYLKNGEVVQVILTFNKTYKNIESSKQSFESSVSKIIQEANKKSSDYEKEKYVHDALIKMITYDKESDINQSAYSALVYNLSVCAGYSKAFQYIMIRLGIPTYYVSGTAGEDHAWNIIKLGNGYYNVDVTWDDNRGTSYNFFNVPDSDFSKTHNRTDLSCYLPSCDSYQYKGLKQTEKKAPIVEKKTIKKEEPKEQPKEQIEPSSTDIIVPSASQEEIVIEPEETKESEEEKSEEINSEEEKSS